ncbi:MAG: galactose-1-phosphate uridylyltransferase [candidate division NC10 bacterium]|nr:galactose-1-phosphate uridylyltransferase [candidate division NC10 bacterium]
MAELRREPILQRWVAITGQRWEVLSELLRQRREQRGRTCPFCPGKEHETPSEVFALRNPTSSRNGEGWSVRVVPNKFPVLRIEGEIERIGEGVFDQASAIGAHEIVIETPSHSADWGTMAVGEVAGVLRAYRQRSLDLRGDERFRQIMIARNHGPGVPIAHPHTHVMALPVIPRRIEDEVRGLLDYHGRKERCGYCDIIRQELSSGVRVIRETGMFLALASYAARYPFETWILPKAHAHDFGTLKDDQLPELAGLLQSLSGALHSLLDEPAYSLVVHTSPLHRFTEPRYHWHMEIRVRLALVGGFEWGTGFFVNPLAPEEAARLLRGEVAEAHPAKSGD